MSGLSRLMVKEDRRTFPSSSSEVEEDDDTEMVRKTALKPNLRWKDENFQEHTFAAFHQMRKQRHFCDVILQIGKQDFPAHRVVLAAASPYFMELFTSDEDQPSRKEIQGGLLYELNGGFTKEALELLIDYAYTARLDVPGDHVKPVYMGAVKLKMERAATECAKFLASHLDLSSCLEIRSTPGVKKRGNDDSKPKERKPTKKSNKNGFENTKTSITAGNRDDQSSSETNGDCGQDVDLVSEVDKFIAANVGLLHDSKQLRSLPQIQIEVLHSSKEEREAALMQPLCDLILDWSQKAWQEDGELTLEDFTLKRYLLFLAADNTLQDCDVIAEGSAIDSEIIQDYKKTNQIHLHHNPNKNVKKHRRIRQTVKPSKPREMLYSRHINQNEIGEDQTDEWKIIACTKLDDQSILGVASFDGQLVTLSIMQRINNPSDSSGGLTNQRDSMSRSVSNVSLDGASAKSRSPRMSRPESIEKETFIPVATMRHAKCAVGAACLNDKLLVCGGYDRGECLNTVESYDVKTNAWTALPSMRNNRGRFDITCVGETVYAVAGSNGQAEINSVEKFHPNHGWSKCTPLPVNLSNIGVCNLDGFVYCVGGTHGPSGTKYCFRYSEETKVWDRIANLNIGRFQAAVACYQGKIWAAGGCDGWNPLNSVEIYDPTVNVWKMGPPLTSPRRGSGLAVRNGKLILVGGNDGTHSLCSTEVLDASDMVWTPGPTMTTCRTNVSVAMVDKKLWAVGGFSGKSFLNTIEYLDPVTDEWTTFIPADFSDENQQILDEALLESTLKEESEHSDLEAVPEVSEDGKDEDAGQDENPVRETEPDQHEPVPEVSENIPE